MGSGSQRQLSRPSAAQQQSCPLQHGHCRALRIRHDQVHDQWQASLGARWDNYRTGGSNIAKGRNDPTGTPDFYSTSREDNLFNHQLGLAYKPLPNGTIYATYGTSSTPSAIAASAISDAASVTSQSLEPEKSRSVELGTKWQVFDDRLTLSGALFQDIRKNTSVAVSATETSQVGEAKVRGIELGFGQHYAQVERVWRLHLHAQRNDQGRL